MTSRLEKLAQRATGERMALSPSEARARLAHCDGPVDAALELEACLGGLTVGDYVLGIDTHRLHPPRDTHDQWLDRSLQRVLVQIGWGGPHRATYWLDDAGWVHEIAPLDRLRPVAASVEEFVERLLDARGFQPHSWLVALPQLRDEDVDAFFDACERCPIGPGVVRWGAHAGRFLEEGSWLARLGTPFSIVSARTFDQLARPLADLVTLEPSLELVFLDAVPGARHDVSLREVWAVAEFRIPWTDGRRPCVIGLDDSGAPTVGISPRG